MSVCLSGIGLLGVAGCQCHRYIAGLAVLCHRLFTTCSWLGGFALRQHSTSKMRWWRHVRAVFITHGTNIELVGYSLATAPDEILSVLLLPCVRCVCVNAFIPHYLTLQIANPAMYPKSSGERWIKLHPHLWGRDLSFRVRLKSPFIWGFIHNWKLPIFTSFISFFRRPCHTLKVLCIIPIPDDHIRQGVKNILALFNGSSCAAIDFVDPIN